MSKVVPNKLIGAWLRESFQMAEGAVSEDSSVIWLQTSNRFIDVRICLPGHKANPESFGGTVCWLAPQLTFNHDVDLNNEGVDVGVISWQGDVLIEDATFEEKGQVVNMQERWLRQTPYSSPSVAMELHNASNTLKGVAVKVGDHAAVIVAGDEFSSAYFIFINGVWVKQWGIGVTPEFEFPERALVGHDYIVNDLRWACVDVVGE
ncbi:hypothetical protein [Dasania marina]|uniref:hypothetical protein n=1 Tax=Dasania marina TaxID=471499 RepID=UPI0030D9F007|tara:strand:- start:76601 stop:77218 length:618 start_codon:yes stop_codon:yes gene_type:complete